MMRIDDPSSRWIVRDQRSERLGLLLRDAGGGLVEQDELRVECDQAAELDDAARARRQFDEQRVGVPTEAEVPDDLVGLLALLALHHR